MIPLLDRRPIIVALAGPNGAGKSTFYRAFLADSGLQFVNADVPSDKIKARFTRTMENLRKALVTLPDVRVFDNSDFHSSFRLVAELAESHMKTYPSVPRWLRPLLPAR